MTGRLMSKEMYNLTLSVKCSWIDVGKFEVRSNLMSGGGSGAWLRACMCCRMPLEVCSHLCGDPTPEGMGVEGPQGYC